MTWSRRAVLGALGGGAAATILWGCGGAQRAAVARVDEDAGVRHWLRDAVARLAGGFTSASALAAIRTRTVATADAGGRAIRGERVRSLVLAARDAAGRRFERVIGDLSATAIDAAVDAMLAGRARRAWSGGFGAPIDAPHAGDDPGRARDDEWTGRAGELHARAEAAGSSRVVYRAGYVEVDDASVWFVGSAPGVDRFQRLVRGRAGAIFVAWSGSRPSAGIAEAAGPFGIGAAAAVSDTDITGAAARALELMTPGAAPDGDSAVVLDPGVAAAIALAGVADVMSAEAWRRADLAARDAWRAAEAVTIVDDPGVASYGGYAFADDGVAAARAVLVDHGAPGQPVTAARRAGFVGPARAGAAHVVIEPGPKSVEALLADVGSGLIVEDAGVARVDPITWELVVPIGRARRLDGGRRTGHVFADLELRASVPALFAAVTGVGAEPRTIARRDDTPDGPRWRSASAPHLATRARIAQRRRA